MEVYKSPKGYYFEKNKNKNLKNESKRISKSEYLKNIKNEIKEDKQKLQIEIKKNKPNNTKPNHTKMNHTKPNHTKPNNTKPNHTKPNHTKPNHTKPNHTKKNHKVNKQNVKAMVVLFYGDWCGHCHHMMPDWEKFMNKNKDNKINIMKIESSNDPVMRRHNIQGFPTIRYLPNGINDTKHIEFKGNRDYINLERFLKSMSKK